MSDSWYESYNIKTNQSDFSLLAHIAIQVQDVEQEIGHTHNFVVTKVKLPTAYFTNHIFIHLQF